MKAEVSLVSNLAPDDVEEMFGLYETYFEATSPGMFRDDLSEKDYVILLRDSEGRIRGFSTSKVIEVSSGVVRTRAVFSGDTIVHHECWGEQTLPLAFATQTGRIKAERPDEPLYWFLITKGYRTYRYLPLFFHEYFPRWDRATPPEMQTRLHTLAGRRFREAYDPETGIIRFPESRGHLREAWAGVRDAVLRKPEVRFFLDRNPGYRHGDELACIAELSAENLRPLVRRPFVDAV